MNERKPIGPLILGMGQILNAPNALEGRDFQGAFMALTRPDLASIKRSLLARGPVLACGIRL